MPGEILRSAEGPQVAAYLEQLLEAHELETGHAATSSRRQIAEDLDLEVRRTRVPEDKAREIFDRLYNSGKEHRVRRRVYHELGLLVEQAKEAQTCTFEPRVPLAAYPGGVPPEGPVTERLYREGLERLRRREELTMRAPAPPFRPQTTTMAAQIGAMRRERERELREGMSRGAPDSADEGGTNASIDSPTREGYRYFEESPHDRLFREHQERKERQTRREQNNAEWRKHSFKPDIRSSQASGPHISRMSSAANLSTTAEGLADEIADNLARQEEAAMARHQELQEISRQASLSARAAAAGHVVLDEAEISEPAMSPVLSRRQSKRGVATTAMTSQNSNKQLRGSPRTGEAQASTEEHVSVSRQASMRRDSSTQATVAVDQVARRSSGRRDQAPQVPHQEQVGRQLSMRRNLSAQVQDHSSGTYSPRQDTSAQDPVTRQRAVRRNSQEALVRQNSMRRKQSPQAQGLPLEDVQIGRYEDEMAMQQEQMVQQRRQSHQSNTSQVSGDMSARGRTRGMGHMSHMYSGGDDIETPARSMSREATAGSMSAVSVASIPYVKPPEAVVVHRQLPASPENMSVSREASNGTFHSLGQTPTMPLRNFSGRLPTHSRTPSASGSSVVVAAVSTSMGESGMCTASLSTLAGAPQQHFLGHRTPGSGIPADGRMVGHVGPAIAGTSPPGVSPRTSFGSVPLPVTAPVRVAVPVGTNMNMNMVAQPAPAWQTASMNSPWLTPQPPVWQQGQGPVANAHHPMGSQTASMPMGQPMRFMAPLAVGAPHR